MTLFDRHIIRRTALTYIGFSLALIVFFIVLHYVEYVDDFMDRGASMRDVFFVYYPSMIPQIVHLMSPLAIFLACVLITGKLAQQMQIMALETAGVSLYRLMLPYVLLAAVLTGFMFWFDGWVVPATNKTVVAFERDYLKEGNAFPEVADIHRQDRPGSILTVDYYDQASGVAHGVTLQQFRDGDHMTARLDAHAMQWVDSLHTWHIRSAISRTFTPDGREIRTVVADVDTSLNIVPRDLIRDERDVDKMTVPVAAEYVSTLRRSGVGDLGRILVSFYSKFTYPLANFILVLLAVPISSVRRRRGQGAQIGIGLLVAFAYLAIMKVVEPFGYTGELSPMLAATLPHALFFVLAIAALVTARS